MRPGGGEKVSRPLVGMNEIFKERNKERLISVLKILRENFAK